MKKPKTTAGERPNLPKIIANFCFYFDLRLVPEMIGYITRESRGTSEKTTTVDNIKKNLKDGPGRKTFWDNIYQQVFPENPQQQPKLQTIFNEMECLLRDPFDRIRRNYIHNLLTQLKQKVDFEKIKIHLGKYSTEAQQQFATITKDIDSAIRFLQPAQKKTKTKTTKTKNRSGQRRKIPTTDDLTNSIQIFCKTILDLGNFVTIRRDFYDYLHTALVEQQTPGLIRTINLIGEILANKKNPEHELCNNTLWLLSRLPISPYHIKQSPFDLSNGPKKVPLDGAKLETKDFKHSHWHWLLLLQNFKAKDIDSLINAVKPEQNFNEVHTFSQTLQASGTKIPQKAPDYYIQYLQSGWFQNNIEKSIKFLFLIVQARNNLIESKTGGKITYKSEASEGPNPAILESYRQLELTLSTITQFNARINRVSDKICNNFIKDFPCSTYIDTLGYQGGNAVFTTKNPIANQDIIGELEKDWPFIETFLHITTTRTTFFKIGRPKLLSEQNENPVGIHELSQPRMLQLIMVTKYLISTFYLKRLRAGSSTKLQPLDTEKIAIALLKYAAVIRSAMKKIGRNSDKQKLVSDFIDKDIPQWVMTIADFIHENINLKKNTGTSRKKSKKKGRKGKTGPTSSEKNAAALARLIHQAIETGNWIAALQLATEYQNIMTSFYPKDQVSPLNTLLHPPEEMGGEEVGEEEVEEEEEKDDTSPYNNLLDFLLKETGNLYQHKEKETTILHKAAHMVAIDVWSENTITLVLKNRATQQLIARDSKRGTVFHRVTSLVKQTVDNMLSDGNNTIAKLTQPKYKTQTGYEQMHMNQNKNALHNRARRIKRLKVLLRIYKKYAEVYKEIHPDGRPPHKIRSRFTKSNPGDNLKIVRMLLKDPNNPVQDSDVLNLLTRWTALVPEKERTNIVSFFQGLSRGPKNVGEGIETTASAEEEQTDEMDSGFVVVPNQEEEEGEEEESEEEESETEDKEEQDGEESDPQDNGQLDMGGI